ncbi:MAG: TetR/AcrR family transcriptional regulator [Firmicutes bacterium]|nr:TetR/AcrR family transcriptional regulator [Bacillota bacterium]
MGTKNQSGRRTYDAAHTKSLILDAAKETFGSEGFSGARIDAIAEASGYNKSLIYQYFGDKLALYTEVVKHADKLGDLAMKAAFDQLLGEPVLDRGRFKTLLADVITLTLEFLFNHPRYLSILFWEAAEEWKTWNSITYHPDDASKLHEVIEQAQSKGIIRADFDPTLFLTFMMSMTAACIRFSHAFGGVWEMGDTKRQQEHLADQVCKFVLHGLLEPAAQM